MNFWLYMTSMPAVHASFWSVTSLKLQWVLLRKAPSEIKKNTEEDRLQFSHKNQKLICTIGSIYRAGIPAVHILRVCIFAVILTKGCWPGHDKGSFACFVHVGVYFRAAASTTTWATLQTWPHLLCTLFSLIQSSFKATRVDVFIYNVH